MGTGPRGPPVGPLLDADDLSHRARAYARSVVAGDRWPLSAVDTSAIAWATSDRMRRQHGRCSYDPDGGCTITLARRVYDRGGFAACRGVVRHELVHAWQHQHRGSTAAVTDDGASLVAEPASPRAGDDLVRVAPGHGPSFRAWVDPLALQGRCSTPYEPEPSDFRYVLECPRCGEWWGKHRLCRRVRQAAHGAVGPAGYCYCTDCGTLTYLRAGDRYLEHGDHDDESIRAFVEGRLEGGPTAAVEGLDPRGRPSKES